jgi:hypothetical protein
MINKRKPIPKSQRELSIERQDPYIPPAGAPGFSPTGNPNDSNQPNRGLQTSFKGDTVKPMSIGIQDIDEAIMYYFQNIIQPSVLQNGEKIPVPVIYGSPEKWKSFQKDGYYRDLQGRIMAPLIMFKRNTITKDRSLNNKLDANNPHNVAVIGQSYNKRNEYSKFSMLNNVKPEKTYYVTVVPDHISITYDCIAFTYYNDQLNKIVEAMEYASDSYWGDPERFKFKATINSFNTTADLSETGERIVRSTFTLNIYGYIIPDTIQKDLKAARKFSDRNRVVFGLETTGGSIENFEANTRQTSAQGTGIANIFDSQNITNNTNTTIITGDIGSIAAYLSANNQVIGSYVNATTITFAYDWLPAPSPLPATNADQFIFFVNGQLIEKTAIVSFTQGTNISTLVIDSTALGFSFISTDEIIGIGKFDV